MVVKLDAKDWRILDELQRNAKQTTGQIAKRTALPVTTVHNRIKRLEHHGIITKYAPVLDYAKLGRGLHALIFITAEGKGTDQEALARQALKLPGVHAVRILTGGYDLVLEARVKDVDELNKLLIKKVRMLRGVDKTQTMLVLEDVN